MASFTGQMKSIPAQSHMGLPPSGSEIRTNIQTYKHTNKQTNTESANCSPAKTYVFNIGQKWEMTSSITSLDEDMENTPLKSPM